MAMITVQDLSKQFGQKTIFSNISFAIKKQEMVALIGPSGSGKSTLLNMIGLLERIDNGHIYINDQLLPNINSRQATLYRRTIINYLFQSNALISTASVKDNLMLAMHFTDLSNKEKEKKLLACLEKVRLQAFYTSCVNTLSGGEQQRVAIARAILKPGSIVLADEPTGSLDPLMAQEAFELIKCLRNDFEKTILMVTHNHEQAKQCDRIIHLK